MIHKRIIQKEVEETILTGKYTEGFGRICLELADVSVYKRGLYYRYNEFEIDFIIKPRIVDMLLLKVFKYEKDKNSSAYTFISLITHTAIVDAIKDIRRAERGETANVFYIEDIGRQISSIIDYDDSCNQNDVYLENNVIKLN